MSTTTRSTSETSVTISLAELARIEQERVREEDAQRARAEERQAREKQEAEAKKRAAEAAEIAAEAEARARRVRAEAEETARIEARERAAAEVARIEAASKARLLADNAARAHEIEVLRVKTESGRKRTVAALATVIGVLLCGGGAAAWSVSQKVSGLAQETERLREGQHALAEEREQAKSTQLAALEKRHAALTARSMAGAEEARAAVESARNAIDRKTLDLHRLRVYADALDALQARLDVQEKLAQLDRRQADLGAWAVERKHTEMVAAARAASARARAMGNEDGLRGYETALENLRQALAQKTAAGGRAAAAAQSGSGTSCLPGEPGCGLNGERVF